MKDPIRVLKYLKTTFILGIFMPYDSFLKRKSSCDSDWITCPDTRRFVNDFCIFLRNSLIS